jgi:uncharacterized protein YbcC (UPF0753/DUF2309 family)
MKTQNSSLDEHKVLHEVKNNSAFDEHEVLHELKHFLPAQAPLKDFIHHNTLHAFQKLKFHKGIREASTMLGYKVSLSLDEFRALYKSQRISPIILEKIILEKKGSGLVKDWLEKVLVKQYEETAPPRIGMLRSNWKKKCQIDLDMLVHPLLFRIVCSYLDQGISIWNFPLWHGFLSSIREIEEKSFTSFLRTPRARKLLLEGKCEIKDLLKILVGDESLYQQYLFDQQFAHQGWSGMVSAIEDQPQTLVDTKKISIRDFIIFELILEIDALDSKLGKDWLPLSSCLTNKPVDLFAKVPETEINEVLTLWQEAYEWTYYDEVLGGLEVPKQDKKKSSFKSFQAMFCIDDRETSLRDYLEKLDPECETFATPGFFGVEFYFQPIKGKFYTKLCPAPVTPKYLIKEVEVGTQKKREKDVHFIKHTHSLLRGWLISQTLGFWAAFRLFLTILRPSVSPATTTSFSHMDSGSRLTFENTNTEHKENGLQVGFTIEEMAQRVEALLRSVGLVKDFAPIVYMIGHGSSSVNNPHYAAYDCGACSGRPGSVNARAFSLMANHPKVRAILSSRGLVIPGETQFLGGLHDTCRDEFYFYDEHLLSLENWESHKKSQLTFNKALDNNSKERSRRFESINTKLTPHKIHEKIKMRSVSLFEPRPELNHATNALCIVGRRDLTKNLFLDRRSFMNSYDYKVDPDGKYLFNILKAAAPVCGGINLEYFFSRTDNQKLGAGTKLPHNVMGLFGVANGIDGDLRPGLPSQMIEVHDPVRLMIIVEHFPEVVLETIQKSPETYEWFINEWVHLVVINPETKKLSLFRDGGYRNYVPSKQFIDSISDITPVLESTQENIPVYLIS